MAIWLDPDEKVKVIKIENGVKYVKASLLADTAAEVRTNGISCSAIEGLGDTDVLYKGSDAFTTSMEYLMLDSSNTWKG